MYISAKYIVLYVGSGLATGLLSRCDKHASLIGLGISCLIGASFSISYALLSSLEFGIGLVIASMLIRSKDS